jgi:hypothetical protein
MADGRWPMADGRWPMADMAWRGVEFLMNYYPVLDQVLEGRDEGDAWQTWIRRPGEY